MSSLNADENVPPAIAADDEDLLHATLSLTSHLDVAQICTTMLEVMEHVLNARGGWILLHQQPDAELVTVGVRGNGAEAYANARIPCDRGIVGLCFKHREAVFVAEPREDNRWFELERVKRSGVKSVLTLPLIVEDDVLGVVGFDCPMFSADTPPTTPDIVRLMAIAAVAAAGIRNARLLEAVTDDRGRLRRLVDERRYLRTQVGHLQEQVREWHSLDTVIGESPVIREVLTRVQLVAPADSTVLLIGETGTGKELIARVLHDQSRRSSKPFVAVNCAALPETLIESELFGYEKGAFTGAVNRKPGKFELAEQGTLFLDEIGDLPAQAQAKLLRVLQEREVQRVGGTRAVPVNVRLISATNQDLGASLHTGQFRHDLFYRLSVFPIRLPPLRERREDIPLLSAHFLRRFAERQHKPVARLTDDAMERLMEYEWPGNIRELQNVIERAVILAPGPFISSALITLQTVAADSSATPAQSTADPALPSSAANVIRFADAERHAIARALELSGWRISGRGGAAEILGLKPTTLHAKMKRLGIRRPGLVPGRAAVSSYGA
jgi:formate hydrogenlyase transcriptional activator